MRVFTERKEAERLLNGILAGDGDIYGRMASSHEFAKPRYPFGLAEIVSQLYESLDPESVLYGKGRELADAFLANNHFDGEFTAEELAEDEEEEA